MNQKQIDALGLMIESIHKPDSRLRGCAHNQECFEELMMWRQRILDLLYQYEKKDDDVGLSTYFSEYITWLIDLGFTKEEVHSQMNRYCRYEDEVIINGPRVSSSS